MVPNDDDDDDDDDDVSNVKKHICHSVSDHIDNSCIQKIRNQLRNF